MSKTSGGSDSKSAANSQPTVTTSLDEVSPRDTQCGIGSWRPPFLQPFANVKGFTAVLAFWSLFGNMNFTYYTAVITQIERNYGLSSSMSGFIKNVDNIGYILTVVLLSHFFRYSNKPKLFAAATVVSSSAIFLFATPHFFFGQSEQIETLNSTSNSTVRTDEEFCSSHSDNSDDKYCGGGLGTLQTFNAGALGIFIVSEILQGMGQSPKFTLSMTYLDDNAKNQAPKYFAYMFSMRAFSPVMGFLLGAWTTSMYVNLQDPGFGPKDSRWVGAWWLGFVICSCVSIVWAVPLLFFPANMKQKDNDQPPPEPMTARQMAKDLPLAFVRLLKNKLYMAIILAVCVRINMIGFMTFFPKYLEFHFGLTASIASILVAAISVTSWGIGPIISGAVMAKFKANTPFRVMKMICVIMTFVVIGNAIMFFIGCPNDKWAGDISGGNMTVVCNADCSCESVRFQPICGDDGLNYYSPCHAGCTQLGTNSSKTGVGTYTGCSCISGGSATIGLCPKHCQSIYPYSVVYAITAFIGSMAVVPTMSVLMRCVSNKDKATSLAIAVSFMQILGFPAPMLAGAVIDTTCMVHQKSACSSRTGACLHYDQDQFRYRMQGMIVIINALALLIYFAALFFSRDVDYCDVKDDGNTEKAAKKDGIEEALDVNNEGKMKPIVGQNGQEETAAMLDGGEQYEA